MQLSENNFEKFANQLSDWHDGNERKFPWQQTKDPYLVWVSEIFLQQTQADRVVEFFVRFTSRYPTVFDLSEVTFEEALPYYRGLGYYGRLRRMLELAKVVVGKYDGLFPRTERELMALPGIGRYTARAIMGFAFGVSVIAPDTNVKRVFERVFGELDLEKVDDIYKRFHAEYGTSDSAHLNQVLMDFGNLICDAKRPKCSECVLQHSCRFYKSGGLKLLEKELEFRRRNRAQRSLRGYEKVVCGVVVKDRKILVTRRKNDQTYAGLLEFPGGKVEKGENLRSALQRELMEEIGIEVAVRPAFRKVVVDKNNCILSFHRCSILKGEVKALEGQELIWLRPDEMMSSEFISHDVGVVEELRQRRFHLY
jgi:A/G-specific adenine glycosylase